MRIDRYNNSNSMNSKPSEIKSDVNNLHNNTVSVYSEAINHIKAAIDTLGKHANTTDDKLAKEEIANLSVVLLELQSADN